MANSNLHNAKRAKQDEFYTQWEDIEREMNAYLEFDPDVFRDKTILLPCDDPEWSNFTKYFALRFTKLGINKLISTSYAPNSNMSGEFYSPQPSLFDDPVYDETKDMERGKIFILDGTDNTGDGIINKEDFVWEYLEGDGDFRSEEVTALRDEADMVITNPPFSLFREFVEWLEEGGVQFSVIGNQNAITYQEIFPMIKDNDLWLGATGNTNDMVFRVPEGVEVRDSDREKAERLGYPTTGTEFYTRLGNSCWFTNIEHGRRHDPLRLMTMEDNRRFNKRIASNETSYVPYDNYNAIEVPVTNGIPSDYDGVMGVPISFLYKYNPEQFEIVKFRKGDDDRDLRLPSGKEPYFRILIRHRDDTA